jgi:hypothetical protein
MVLVMFVPAQTGIWGFEVIQRVQFFWLLIEEGLLCKAHSWSKNFVLRDIGI